MTPHVTLLPPTADARYHARRKARLVARLGNVCVWCGAGPTLSRPVGYLQVDHTHGDGGERRAEAGNSAEITRLLALPEGELHAQVRLLCDPCHASAPTTVRFRSV